MVHAPLHRAVAALCGHVTNPVQVLTNLVFLALQIDTDHQIRGQIYDQH
jgi:hypothetical protein